VRCCSSKSILERILNRSAVRTVGLPGALAFATDAAQAHGFGERFDLPLPLWLWLTGAGATIVLTFAALALFARGRDFATIARSVDLLQQPALRRIAHPLAVVLRVIAGALFVLTLATGFFGNQDAYANLIVTMVWVLWWVGMAFFCALVGDLWELVDPLRTLYRAVVEMLCLRRESLGLVYPPWLGAWPAVVLYFGFAWIELIWQDKDVPRALAGAMLGYALLCWTGMFLFGVETWRSRADAFALAFGVLARFAPLELRSSTPTEPARLRLRPYAAGLLTNEPVSKPVMVFVLLMLATVTFDGFHQTPLMERLETAAQTWRPVAETLYVLSAWGLGETQLLHTFLLLLFPLAFVLIFRGVSRLMLRLAGPIDGGAANAMVWSLVPIAVAYHLSHYLTLLLTTGQFGIALASDPFGWGWDLFGTRDRPVDLGFVSPAVYWYGAVALIVIGHVLAVIVAHIEARRGFASHRAALLSQLPMVALMVAYTSLSLWIMAQPIVG
jgi:hypothetical protein